jgi:hypothetical protein
VVHWKPRQKGLEFEVSLSYIARSCFKKSKNNLKRVSRGRHWWLTPEIIGTQEAEIRRITIQSQPQANSSQDSILKIPITEIGLVEWLKV